MNIHRMGTCQKFREMVVADSQYDRQADSGPDGIATTYPVPEGEQVVMMNAEFFNGFPVG